MDYERNTDRLVLGYLKDECKYAYKIFFKSHFSHNRKYLGNHISTRIAGKTLRDILAEYGHICDIIQGKLEQTNYYEEHNADVYSPIKQLNYLLNIIPGESRASTPFSSIACNRSPAPVESAQEVSSSDVETTPEHTLPGNVQCLSENSYFQKDSKRELSNANRSVNTVENIPTQKISEIAQKLLEKKELHSKLASTINAVLNTSSETPKLVEDQNLEGPNTELDATIKTVIKKTEEDPIFENLIQEIIDGTPSLDSLQTENNDGLQEAYKSMSEFLKPKNHDSVVQNNSNTLMITSQPSQDFSKPPITKPNEVMMFEGNLDNYIKTTACSMPTQMPIQNPIGLINGSIVMVPRSPVLQHTMHPQCFIVNNTPQILFNSNKLSAEEIMAMPTVILNDDKNKQIKPSVLPPQEKNRRTLKAVAPNPIIEIPVNTGECITLYGGRDVVANSQKPKTVGLKRTLPPRLRPRDKKVSVSSSPHEEETNNEKRDAQNTEEVDGENEEAKVPKPAPIPKTPITSAGMKKTTPKSGSHVRSLDFSTPPKITSSTKKSARSPEFVHKKQAAKTLFKSRTMEAYIILDDDEPAPDKKKKSNAMVCQWDKNIREAIGVPVDSKQSPILKRRRGNAPRSKKKVKKPKEDLNSTDHDGKMLEVALATPQKNDNEESVVNDSGNTKIMSPSKVIGSKKNVLIVSSDVKQSEEDQEKLITPDMPKDNVPHPIGNAKRNINEMLETPMKDDFPKTPGVVTPGTVNNILTPCTFSKTIEVNFKDVDLNSINTPHFPCTPSFPPFTPGLPDSEYANRRTDYSATSAESYYQPSDSEHNRSIESVLKEEAGRLEKENQVNIISDVVVKQGEMKKEEKHVSLGDHLRVFNKNVIGKKNLSLLTRDSSETTSSESVTSESGNEDDFDASNKTVICVKNEAEIVKSTYSLRARTSNKESKESTVALNTSKDEEVQEKREQEKPKVVKTSNKEKNSKSTAKSKSSKPSVSDKDDHKENKRSSKTSNKSKSKQKSSKEPTEKGDKHKMNISDDKKTTNKNYKEKSTERDVSNNKAKNEEESKAEGKNEENKNKHSQDIEEQDSQKIESNKQLHVEINRISCTESDKVIIQEKDVSSEKDIKEIISNVHVQNTLTKDQLIESNREKIMKEMEAKKRRTIEHFKSESKMKSSKVTNRKPPTKPRTNQSARKNKRKSDSPRKSLTAKKDVSSFMPDLSSSEEENEPQANDKKIEAKCMTPPPAEAQNLIEGLKERGIHLMHNKITKKTEHSDVTKPNEQKNQMQPADVETPKGTQEKNPVSSTNDDSDEQYDIKIYKQETVHIVFDDRQKSSKTYDISLLEKARFCKIMIDDDQEYKVPIKATDFIELLDIPSTVNVLIPRKKKVSERKSLELKDQDEKLSGVDDDLMNYAIVGSVREENPEELPKSSSSNPKKRKSRADSSNLSSASEKKAKLDPGATLLKQLDVDLFLDQIHGEGK